MIALYVRVSTVEQMKDGYSIGEQQERLKAFCVARGWSDFKLFTDGGYSGGNMNRPALQSMVKAIEDGKVKKVIVYKLDRLSRSQKDTLFLLENVFLPHGVDFISMSESFDTGSAFGKATIGLFSVFAQLERDTIRERVTLGREARAKEGKWHGGNSTPIGYNYTNGGLVVDDFEAMQVREIYKQYQNGRTFTEIANDLNERGWMHKHGRWMPKRVRRVLSNPVYIGTVTFGGKTSEGVHEAIIDTKTFDRVAAMIGTKTGKTYKRRPISEAYLSGRVYCSRCGARYTHVRLTSGHKPNGHKLSYYSCSNRLHPNRTGVKCGNTNHRCDAVDEAIFDELRSLRLADVKAYRQEKQEPDTAGTLQKELAKIEKQRSRLIDLFALGSFDADELTAKIEPLTASKNAIEEQLAELSAEHRSMKDMKNIVKTIGTVIDNGTPEQKRHLIDLLIDHVEIDGEDITIFWDFD